jgi:hypothetical protein
VRFFQNVFSAFLAFFVYPGCFSRAASPREIMLLRETELPILKFPNPTLKFPKTLDLIEH